MSSPNHPTLQQLRDLDRSLPGFHDRLNDFLHKEVYQRWVYGENYQQRVVNLQGDDLAWLVDYLDKALDVDGLEPSGPAFRKYLRELKTICGASGILPPSYTLSSSILKIGPKPFASGGFGDVYEGTLDGLTVCIKYVRVYTCYPQQAAKTFCQEAVMWKRLIHPNIVPLLGVTIDPFQLISEWMPGGDLPKYIKKNPNVDRLGLLSDATEGLCYLHSCNVIHGDLKGPNILVDNSGRVRLADFGLATVAQNPNSMQIASLQHGYTPGWTAPEVLNTEACSKKADVFSLAMVMIEVYTGATPFSNGSPFATAMAVLRGERPNQPTHPAFTEDLWALVQRCWDQDPYLRPEVAEVLDILRSSSTSRPFLQRLHHLNKSSPGFYNQLTEVLYGEDYQQRAPNLQGDDLVWLVDYLDKAFEGLEPTSPAFQKCLHKLSSICITRMTLPTSYTISSHLLNVDPKPFAYGGFGDLYHGVLDGSRVCIKRIRLSTTGDPQKATQYFCQEAVMWKRLTHPNILPLLGVTITPLQLISNWMPGGQLPEYIRKHPDADRLRLLSDVIEGLCYIHSCNIIHGNLNGQNVLVDDSGRARIAGFDLAAITRNLDSVRSVSLQRRYIPQLTAPEVLMGEQFTKEADVFSFAMVAIEVYTGATPFSNGSPFATALAVLRGERPNQPTHPAFTENLWTLVQRCWDQDPNLRPKASEALQVLLRPSYDVDGVVETGIDDQVNDTASDPSPSVPHSDKGPLVPPQDHPHPTPILELTPNYPHGDLPVTRSETSLPAPLQRGSSEREWIARMARGARKFLKSIARKFPGL